MPILFNKGREIVRLMKKIIIHKYTENIIIVDNKLINKNLSIYYLII